MITLERQPPGGSLVHGLDARVKVITTVLLLIGILLTPPRAWLAYPLIWTLIGSLAAISQVSAWRITRQAGLVLTFTLAALPLLVTTPGPPVVTIAGLTITASGLARFVEIGLKSWLSLQVTLLFTHTTPFTGVVWALAALGVSTTLVTILNFMYRYLFTLKDEAERLLRARSARSGTVAGYRSGGSLVWRARVAGGMVGSLFLRSYERSERIYAAMLARGYTGPLRTGETPPLTRQAVILGTAPVLVMVLIQLVIRI